MKRNLPVIIIILGAAMILSGFLVKSNLPSEKKNDIPDNLVVRGEDNPKEAINALQFLSESRSFPNVDVPTDGFGKAWDYYVSHYKNVNARIKNTEREKLGGWTNFGPNNIGGRTLSIAIDPTDTAVIYMGSASGGLWKSTTGGIGTNAWTYIPTGFPVLGVSSIAINPNNHNEIFIGTGETYDYGSSLIGLIDRTTRGTAGIGILKSSNGGVTWTQSLNWTFQSNRCVWKIAYNPLQTNTLYAATTEGVYKSMNGGTTWNNVLPQLMAMDLLIHNIDTNIVFVSVGNLNSANKGLYTSINSGATWSIVGGGLPANTQTGRIIISNYATNNDIMMCEVWNAGSTVGIYTSINKGVTWIHVSAGTDVAQWQGWYANGILMQKGNNNKVIMGGVYIFNSTNFGTTFNNGNNGNYHTDIHGIIGNPLAPNKIYIITDNGLFRSGDFGTNDFESCSDGYVTSQHYIGAVSTTNSTLALSGLQDNATAQYVNSLYWNQEIGGDGLACAIDNSNDQIQYGCYEYMNIYKTTDAWVSTITQSLNNNYYLTGLNTTAFLAPMVLCRSNNQYLYTGGDSLVRTTNGGTSWNQIGPVPLDSGNVLLSIGVASTSIDTIYCGTAPNESNRPCRIFRSYNGGTSFTNITGTLPNRYPRQITVNPTNSKEVYIAYSGFSGINGGHLFKSIDAGNTWTDISTTLPDIPFHCIAVDPLIPNNLYAGCDFGCFVSYDDGATWTALDTGFPDVVMVFDLVVSPADRNMLAFTYGHGAYRIALPSPTGINPTAPYISNLSVYPNPAKDNLTISIENLKDGNIELTLLDMNGKVVINKNAVATKGRNLITMDISNLKSATYLLVSDDGQHKTAKRVVILN